MKIWFITGSSTGLGRSLAEELLAKGYSVAATARNPAALSALQKKYGPKVLLPVLDVTNPDQVRSALNDTIKHFGRIDVVVNNAGYGLVGAIEEVTDEEIRSQFETNFFGALEVIRTVLPHFRKQKSGHFLNMSSVSGFRSTHGAGLYNASKFALEGLSEALAKDTVHLGIKVTIVEPGPFRTDFGGRSVNITEKVIDDYVPTAGKMREYYHDVHGKQVGDPRKAALAMIMAVESETPPLRLPLGPMTLTAMRDKLAQVEGDLKTWEEIATKTSFDNDSKPSNK